MMRNALCMLVVVTLALTATARAQFFAGSFGGGDIEPPVSSSDIGRMATILNLSATQREAVEDFQQALLAQYNRARERMQKIEDGLEQEIERDRDFNVLNEFFDVTESFERYIDRLHDAFNDDVQLLLTDDQMMQWPAYERYLRRARAFEDNSELLAGQHVDLIELVRDLELSEEVRTDVDGALLRYELDLDRLLADHEEQRKEQEREMRDKFTQMDNFFAMMPYFQEQVNIARKRELKMRALTESFASRIRASLPEGQSDEFEQDFNVRAWPEVYKENYVTSSFDTVLDFEDLTSDQRGSIMEIRQRYEQRLAEANRAWVKALRESDEQLKGIFDFFGGKDAALDKAQKSRDAIDKQTFEELRGLLTDTQAARLPGQEDDIDWRAMGNFDGW
ncbi:MAG: hypothetical protein AAFX05_08180 [Planctomycetota bacterium]